VIHFGKIIKELPLFVKQKIGPLTPKCSGGFGCSLEILNGIRTTYSGFQNSFSLNNFLFDVFVQEISYAATGLIIIRTIIGVMKYKKGDVYVGNWVFDQMSGPGIKYSCAFFHTS
jgi:hypothetical protein